MRPLLITLLLTITASLAHAESTDGSVEPMFAEVPAGAAPSGVLYDRVLPLSDLRDMDGGVYSPAVSLARWRQAYHEMRRASDDPSALPSLEELRARRQSFELQSAGPGEPIPIAILDYSYDRLRKDAFETGKARIDGARLHLNAGALESAWVFSAAPLREYSFHGSEVRFYFPNELYFSNPQGAEGGGQTKGAHARPVKLLLDASDGLGLREVMDSRNASNGSGHGSGFRNALASAAITARYATPGRKQLRLSAIYADGSVRNASFFFTVKALAAPAPDDTLQLTASILHDGIGASGEAYLYYAPGHNSLVQPVVLIEGFDLDDSMNWDEVYELLNTENLLEDMRAAGYDVVMLNFDDATTDIQRNSYLVVELLQQVQQLIDPRAHFTLAGASMGGLCSRYALAYMEQNALPHRVNTWISFDAPHGGANVPLGLQYWLDFFDEQSADAAFLLSRLDRPAARQLLVYHHLASAGLADPLRADFLADLAALGNYPSQPRRVAIANGSGSGQSQGFAPGAQLIEWEFNNILTQITGNVWAVGDGPSTRIFDGSINILFIPIDDLTISVGGTDPYDSAPGGSRASMQQAGDTEAPYGDIIALHGSHCFIPTISALGLNTGDLFYDVAGDADLLSLTNFDALYFPVGNEGHVQVTMQNAQWIKDELFGSPTATDPQPLARPTLALHQNVPNPFNPQTTIRFELATTSNVRLDIYDVRGRQLRTLVEGALEAGEHRVVWDGRDAGGQAVSSGVYLVKLHADDLASSRRMTLVR